MAFIDKKDPVVLNIKITSKGRETLSKGHLHFRYYAIGDSEIDYEFLRNAQGGVSQLTPANTFDPFNSKILRPADKNPNMISFVTKNFITQTDLLDEFTDDNQYTAIDEVPSITWEVENGTDCIGFFCKSGDTFSFKNTEEFVKQPDLMAVVSSPREARLFQAPTYGANRNNPVAGDFLLVRWKDEDADFETTGYTINREKATPILIYKITGVTGSVTDNDLVVEVDRDLPNFTTDNYAGAMILYSNTSENLEQQYSTDYASEALISFLQNCQCDTLVFPFWKMSIIYTENIPGVKTTDKQFTKHNTAPYAGFVNYIQNHNKIYDKLGVIHYSNVSPSNAYGEQFLRRTPMIHLPTIMWHKSTGTTVGVTLRAVGDLKQVVGSGLGAPSLNTNYYDLADDSGNVVGKVFVDLKIFVIEDPELLFAMSYKSNRSWTLPNFSVGANDSITDCLECLAADLVMTYTASDTTSIGGSDGSIRIDNVSGLVIEDPTKVYVKIERISGGTGIFHSEILNTFGKTFGNLPAGTYSVTLTDIGAPYTEDCDTIITDIEIKDPQLIAFRSTGDDDEGVQAIGDDNLKI